MEILSKLVRKQVYILFFFQILFSLLRFMFYFHILASVRIQLMLSMFWLQVWRLPKLWVGFLKCVSQTQPHSFNVLLQVYDIDNYNLLGQFPMSFIVYIHMQLSFIFDACSYHRRNLKVPWANIQTSKLPLLILLASQVLKLHCLGIFLCICFIHTILCNFTASLDRLIGSKGWFCISLG